MSKLQFPTFAAAVGVCLVTSVAHAQPVTPLPNQAAAAPPANTATPISATCTLGDHPGVDPNDARVAADLICHELAKERVANGQHEVRFGKLGKRTIVTLAARNGNAYDERRVLVSNMEEVHTASPRLVSALARGTPLEDTRTVDNVLSSETNRGETRKGSVGFDATLFGATGVGTASGATAGAGAGVLFRMENLAVNAQGRGGGVGSVEPKLTMATFDVGLRYYVTRSDFSPFVGGGLGLGYYRLFRGTEAPMLEGSGFTSYLQVGTELLRTHHTALSVSARLDVPFYTLEGGAQRESRYMTPLSLNVGLLFH